MKEYVYFVDCPYPFGLFNQYTENMNVIYHAVMNGFVNLWIVSNQEIDIEKNVVLGGLRSDFHVSYAPNHSWKEAVKIMKRKIVTFNHKEYKSNEIIKTHWDEVVEWNEEDEKLFTEFKYNARKKLTPIMKKHLISGQKIYEFIGSIHEYCTVYTMYFPETLFR